MKESHNEGKYFSCSSTIRVFPKYIIYLIPINWIHSSSVLAHDFVHIQLGNRMFLDSFGIRHFENCSILRNKFSRTQLSSMIHVDFVEAVAFCSIALHFPKGF